MRGERGYTLVELMIAIAITGLITTGLALVAQQMLTVPERGNSQVAALHAIQNAAHWVGLDGQAAKSASGGSGLILTLPDNSTVSYVLYGDELNRIYSGSNRTIARNITSANFSVQDRVITMDIISSPDGRFEVSENQTYQIHMRPTE